ncbi:MAG: hemin uptake protein HemP [Pseudomonadota bacterium]
MQDRSGSSRLPDGEVGDVDATNTGGVRRIASTVLFDGANELIIEHDSDSYRLRCTAKGKLILTK